MAKKVAKSGEIIIGFHGGNILLYLADWYASIEQVVLELVQNQIDAGTTVGLIEVDLLHNSLRTLDNGKGASLAEMRTRIQNIGAKLKGLDDLGGKGIGNLAPLGIIGPTGKYRLTTRPKSQNKGASNKFFTIPFDRKEVEGKKVPKLKPIWEPQGFKLEDHATTSVYADGIQESALMEGKENEDFHQDLATLVAETYSAFLFRQERHILIRVIRPDGKVTEAKVVPQAFPGEKFEVSIDTGFGPVKFEAYLTIKKHRNPRVVVRYADKFDFKLSGIREIWGTVRTELASGHLQAIIHIGEEFGELNASRTRLRAGPGLTSLADAILIFAADYVDPWLRRLEREIRVERYNKIVETVLNRFYSFVDGDGVLRDLLKSVVAKGRPPEGGEVMGGRTSRPRKRPRVPSFVPPKEVGPKKKDGGVRGHGHSGGSVFHHSSGLAVRIVEADPADKHGMAWRIRIETTGRYKGQILVNSSHEDFKASDSTRKGMSASLDTYLSLLIMGLFTAQKIRPEDRPAFTNPYEQILLKYRSAIVPRIPQQADIIKE